MKLKFQNFLESKTAKRILFGTGALLVLLMVFQAGIFVGYKKASHSLRAGDNFSRTFGGRDRGFGGGMPGFPLMDPTNAFGTAGKILGVTLPNIIVEDRDGTEKTVVIATSTDIKRFRDTIAPEQLSAGNMIVVVGEPDAEGVIRAKLVRVLPAPPAQDSADIGR